jgi:hypothetical protein
MGHAAKKPLPVGTLPAAVDRMADTDTLVSQTRSPNFGTFHASGRGSAWLERLVRDQEVAGSNPVAPTILQIRPFGENVERLSLCSDETYVGQSAVQTNGIAPYLAAFSSSLITLSTSS